MTKAVHLGSAANGHFADIVEMLVLCLTLEGDEAVQSVLRPEGSGRFSVRQGVRPIWIEVGDGRPGQVHRSRPGHLAEIVLPSMQSNDWTVTEAIRSSSTRSVAQKRASAMLAAFASMSEMPGRQSVETIMQWAPALEMQAYGAATSISTVLDQDRRLLFAQRPRDERTAASARRRYWKMLNLMGRVILLSTPREAGEWLSEMAGSFEWITWTPSWTLFRERSLWLAAIAARAAAAFGVAVADRYLEMLGRAQTPMRIFDALFGLTAIGLGTPSHRRELLIEMERSVERLKRRHALDEPTVRLATVQAIDILREPAIAAERSEAALAEFGMKQGLFAPGILTSDGARPLKVWGHPAFTALPFALNAQVSSFFPVVASSKPGLHLGLSNSEIKALIVNAWSADRWVVNATLH